MKHIFIYTVCPDRQLHGAVKKSVQPKFLNESHPQDQAKQANPAQMQDAVATAAMAAASAVAATQPFLRVKILTLE